MTLQISEIGQIAIAVQDIARAKQFYQEVLGLPFLFDAPPALSFFRCGTVRLMLTMPQGEAADHHTSVIYYKVASLQEAGEHLQSTGVKWLQSPSFVAKMADHELWMAFIRDPDSNLIGLMEEKSIG